MYLVAIMDTIIYLYRPQQLISFRKTTIFYTKKDIQEIILECL